MNKTSLYLNKFYLLGGESKDEKKYFIEQLKQNNIPNEALLEYEGLVKSIFGVSQSDSNDYLDIKKPNLKHMFLEFVSIRASQNLSTFVNLDYLTKEEIKNVLNILNKHGVNADFINFGEVDEHVKNDKFISKFKSINYSGEKYEIIPDLILSKKLDVIGDVHGMFDELVELVKIVGWSFDGEKFEHQDKERKLFFLGDIVDRGIDSIKTLIAIKKTSDAGNAILILGNHEEKLLQSYFKLKEENILNYKSLSSGITFSNFVKLTSEVQKELIDFLNTREIKKSVWIDKETLDATNDKDKSLFKVGFCHANNKTFDEAFMPRSFALYGNRKRSSDVDGDYEENFYKNINQHVLFRGHVFKTSQRNNVFSLEEDQAFNGNLVLLQLDKYVELVKENNWKSEHELFQKSSVRFKTNFNFDEYVKERIMILKEMNKLVADGLATDGWKKDETGDKKPHEDGFKVYKYSKKVHFKRLWKSNPWLEKARGIVLDGIGNIVVHPFDKLYNFGEYDTGKSLPKNTEVKMIEKVNGFLGCISKHPSKNELVLSTTGSISKDAPFVKYIADFITPELNGKLLSFFNENNKTLMFEVVHPEDPHIIEYSDNDYGLWLIGSRDKVLEAKTDSEEYLDKISTKLGFKRPAWEVKEFGEVLDILQTSQLEGYMIRRQDNDEPLMKIKTNYYLVTKFVGRMGENMVTMMFNKPEQFKENKVDEEFYPIVDKIISKATEEDFKNMSQANRVVFVRDIVNETRNEFLSAKSGLKLR